MLFWFLSEDISFSKHLEEEMWFFKIKAHRDSSEPEGAWNNVCTFPLITFLSWNVY